jgi:fructose-1,6-bisphosphatase/sedoheptulose 1,7-bisphosphatase-like protein
MSKSAKKQESFIKKKEQMILLVLEEIEKLKKVAIEWHRVQGCGDRNSFGSNFDQHELDCFRDALQDFHIKACKIIGEKSVYDAMKILDKASAKIYGEGYL